MAKPVYPISKKRKDDKKESTKVLTPMGRFSYPNLATPDEGRKYSDGKYKTDLLMTKEDFKVDGKALREMVLKVGRAFYNDESLALTDFWNPFKDMDKVEDIQDHEKGCVCITAKSDYPPAVFGPDKEPLDAEEIAAIKGGDYGRLIVSVYPFSHGDGGVTLALVGVQYARAGKAFGQGQKALLNMLDEIEVSADEPEIEVAVEEEEEKPSPKKTKVVKKAVKKEEAEEIEEDDDLSF